MPANASPEHQIISSVSQTTSDKPWYICEICWKGVIANQLGILSPRLKQSSNLEPCTGGFGYRIAMKNLTSGVEQGCRWCQFLNRYLFSESALSSEPVPPLENVLEVRVGYASHHRSMENKQDKEDLLSVHVNDRFRWGGYVYTTEGDPAAAFVRDRNLFREVGSERAISLAKELLQDCILNHSGCLPPSESCCCLPTRVVDCSDPSRPRLFVTHGMRDHYIALSYVWGEAQPHRTTKQNFDSYTRSIDFKSLPSTIVDAIQITHKLGMRYLWIDSLCIIQDSEEDKDHELARMRNVYSDSYLTIIAASAHRVSEGFLEKRAETLGSADVTLPFILPNVNGSISLHCQHDVTMTPRYNPADEPVHKRGWCMQEYSLARRKLIFATHTLQYRCQRGTRNVARSSDLRWATAQDDLSFILNLPKSPETRKEMEKVRQAWKTTVKSYTQRSISVSSDKLVAISSLAEEFSHIVKAPYRAGLWESMILPDLLWKKERYDIPPRPKEYRAPSWSWSSVDCEVDPGSAYFRNDNQTLIAELVRCETTLKNNMLPFGEVTAGKLVLRARVIFGCVIDMLPDWVVYCRTRDPKGSTEGGKEVKSRCWLRKRKPIDLQKMRKIGIGWIDSSDDMTRGLRHISVVPIYRQVLLSEVIVQGLMVERLESRPTDKSGEIKYRRIGFFRGTDSIEQLDGWLEYPEVTIEII